MPAQIDIKIRVSRLCSNFHIHFFQRQKKLNTKIGETPRYVIYSVTCDGSGNIYLNGAAPGKKIIGVFPLNNELRIQSVGFSGNAYYAFCTDFNGGSCANRPVTIGVLYVD